MDWNLFAGVPESDVREVLKYARRRNFGRGEVVFHQHDPADSLHLIVRGRFAFRTMTPVGDVVTLGVRGPAESFGEMAVVDEQGKRSATVAALEPAETLAVFRDDFSALRRTCQSIDQMLIAFLVNEVRTLNDRLLEALFVPVERRVRRRLVELATVYAGGDGTAIIPLTQEVVAELSGARRATVNQVLRQEQERGTVELGRGRIRVTDRDGLQRRS
ncbi:MAG TPA: Crp/Fnr family transcriptional regulator [Gaiellaceae bacterium]|nr:Crp/Fnr family transcriptional regulator [Gaiellaceae bacterium]